MKTLLLAALSLFGSFFSIMCDSSDVTKHYVIHARGTENKVNLTWKNILGMGKITGTIEGMPAKGKNTNPGQIEITCEDLYFQFTKVREGSNTFRWVGTGYDLKDCSDFKVIMIPVSNPSNLHQSTELVTLFQPQS